MDDDGSEHASARAARAAEENRVATMNFIYNPKAEEEQYFDPDKRRLVKTKAEDGRYHAAKDERAIRKLGPGDKHAWLGTEFPAPCALRGASGAPYPSLEHALQASKCAKSNEAGRAAIRAAADGREVRKLGTQALRARPAAAFEAWKARAPGIMRGLLLDKFARDPKLRAKLVATGRRTVVHENAFGDRFWGVDKASGAGENTLGALVEEVRAVARRGDEDVVHAWVDAAFDAAPAVSVAWRFAVSRDGDGAAPDPLEPVDGRNPIALGKALGSEVTLEHASCSRAHAVLVLEAGAAEPTLVDVGSSNGTFVDGVRLAPFCGARLAPGAVVSFAASSRRYVVAVDADAATARRQAAYSAAAAAPADGGAAAAGGEGSGGAGGNSRSDPARTVFVGNLAYDASEDDVRKVFEGIGAMETVRVPLDRDSGKARGIAFVTFKEAISAHRALVCDGDDLKGRRMKVKRSDADAKKRPHDGGAGAAGAAGAAAAAGYGGGGGGGGRGAYGSGRDRDEQKRRRSRSPDRQHGGRRDGDGRDDGGRRDDRRRDDRGRDDGGRRDDRRRDDRGRDDRGRDDGGRDDGGRRDDRHRDDRHRDDRHRGDRHGDRRRRRSRSRSRDREAGAGAGAA